MAKLFSKSYEHDGGTDIILQENLILPAGKMTVVHLNVNVNPPKNHLAIVCPRSSFALQGIFIANCPIDTDYTGNIRAIVFNAGDKDVLVTKGERFCQFIVLKCKPNLYKIEPKFKTKRKNKGWGSSGV